MSKRQHKWPTEKRASAAERMRALNADPEFKARNAERMRALHADPEFKARNAERMRALHADPEFKARNAERMRARRLDLTSSQRKVYEKLRHCGFPREAAMAEAQKTQ